MHENSIFFSPHPCRAFPHDPYLRKKMIFNKKEKKMKDKKINFFNHTLTVE
jgi:hypothetical protein